MAQYDPYAESNVLSRLEIINRTIVRSIFWITLLDILSWSFHSSRVFHFETVQTAIWLSVSILFLSSSFRMNSAIKYGRDPYMESSRTWRAGKNMLGAYDFFGPGPDYSYAPHNRIYYTTVCLVLTYLTCELLNVNWSALMDATLDLLIDIVSFILPPTTPIDEV
jgi:hypothetical protein